MSDLSGITKLFTTDSEELIALKRRVMGDVYCPEWHADAIYCVGGTVDTQAQGLKRGRQLWIRGCAEVIGILRGKTDHGYCGFEYCRDWLTEHSMPDYAVVLVDILPEDADALNTYTEGKALLHHARANGWKRIIICAPFFHQIRASSTFISLLDVLNPEIWFFNQPGEPGNLTKKMRHSQGVVEGDMLDLLISEFGRLFRYHDSGPIRPCSELLAYYDKRDKTLLSPI